MASSNEKVSSNKRKKCGFTLSYACAMFHPGLCSPSISSIVSNDSGSGQRRPWSDCAGAQSDLGLHCLRMPEGTFSLGVAQIILWIWVNELR